VWRSGGFRAAVAKKLADTAESCGVHLPKDPPGVVAGSRAASNSLLAAEDRSNANANASANSDAKSNGGGPCLLRSPAVLEAHIFRRARTKEEYLEAAARIIVCFREQRVKEMLRQRRKRFISMCTGYGQGEVVQIKRARSGSGSLPASSGEHTCSNSHGAATKSAAAAAAKAWTVACGSTQ